MAFVPVYILILGFTIVIDYFAGQYIEKSEGKRRKNWLVASLIANIGVLAIFKYYNFLNDNVTAFLNIVNYTNQIPYLDIILPIGLSFHTFQAMSYTIEVYRGNQKAERNFGIYALYVMFYPQLVAGPIERPQNLIHQFYEKHIFEFKRVSEGLKLMLWGFFMKLVVADRVAIYVNAVYNNSENHTGQSLALATVLFAFQIYCDFAGYSNIAIGAAKVMGFKLMTNFKRPYFSTSISEFWKRWHISLSTWFKDYLYISLGGNRVSIPRWYINLIIVFIISGLWHGANWTYLVWGALNGIYLVFAIISFKWRVKVETLFNLNKIPKINNLLQITITFILICLSWVFFRVSDVSEGIEIVKKILIFKGPLFIDATTLTYSFLGIIILLLFDLKDEFTIENYFFNSKNIVIRYLSIIFIVEMIVYFGVFDGGQFIYFQF
jgi:D-alanyl-lipoteichoic acid acyltransferase DltB (MBOAT superfamily)